MSKQDILTSSRRKKAEALLKDKHFDEARILLQEICKQDPQDADAWLLLGITNGHLRNLEETVTCNQRAITLRPDFWQAHFNLGNALQQLGHLDEAEVSYKQTIRLNPGWPEAHINLGTILQARGNPDEALACYSRALATNSANPRALQSMATLQFSQGKFDDALHTYQLLERLNPEQVNIPLIKAEMLERQGQFDKAYDIIKPLIDQGKDNPKIVWNYSSICRHLGYRKEAIAMLKRVLSDQNEIINDVVRASINFRLGELYDAEQDYDQAFKYIQTANELTRMKFDGDALSAHVDKLIETFNPRFLSKLPHSLNDSERPVFIVGMPRSGTTLVEQILSSHPEVFGAGELEHIYLAIDNLPKMVALQKPYPDCLVELTQETYDQIAQSYLDHLTQLSTGERYVINKTPGNFLHLGFIALLFPRARIIHCTRDPMDTCLSCYFSKFRGANTHSYAYRLEDLGHYYRNYERLMQHWNAVLDIPILNISYEALIADQEGMTHRLLDFLELEWNEACLRFHENKRFVNTLSYNQVRQPINTRSIGRWKHYEPYLEPLKTSLLNS